MLKPFCDFYMLVKINFQKSAMRHIYYTTKMTINAHDI